jgi:hypothetical protein
MWIVVGLGVWALLRFRSGVADSREDPFAPSAPALDAVLSPGVIVRCLLIFNALFAVQTVLDLCYLWGGAKLPAGMTYASYAHRGAYPLLATALLAAVFVVATFRAGSETDRLLWARRLVYAWLAQNVFLMVSAGWRLCLYVNVYTLTRWRIAAAIWMFLIACGLVWILVRIITGRSNLWLVNANAVTLLAVLYVCSFINFDGLIADFNVRHCKEVRGEGVPIDVEYLEGLGPEALPALIWLDRKLGECPQRQAILDAVLHLQQRLYQDMKNWRGWTQRRHMLAALRAASEQKTDGRTP